MRTAMLTAVATFSVLVITSAPNRAQSSTGVLELQSVSSAGSQGNQDSDLAAFSANHRFVAFASFASNLVPNDTNDSSDIFVRDRLTGFTERVSVGPLGVEGNGHSGIISLMGGPSLSETGRYVAFSSEASNFGFLDLNGNADVFVYDRRTRQIELISVGFDNAPATGMDPEISADGRYVCFRSFSDTLVTGDTNFAADIFVRDRQSGTTQRVSVKTGGGQLGIGAFQSSMSANGRFIAFDSGEDLIVAGDEDGAHDVFVHDRQTGVTEGISTIVPRPSFTGTSLLGSITPNGRYVTFVSDEPGLVTGDTNFFNDGFLYDRNTDTVTLVSRNSSGVQGDFDSSAPFARADGQVVIFSSRAGNLVAGDTNGQTDVFRRNLVTGTTERIAADDDGFPFAVDVNAITPDAETIAMATRADLLPEEDIGFFGLDIYTLDRHATADLSLTLTDSPDPVEDNEDLFYTIVIENNGPAKATHVTLVDAIPDNTRFRDVEASQGECALDHGGTNRDVICHLGSINSGQTATVTIEMRSRNPGTTITNTATVRAIQPDPDLANNTASETTTIIP